MNPTPSQTDRDAEYEREHDEAQTNQTTLPERTDDMPPPDLFHAAEQLTRTLQSQTGGREAAEEMDLALDAPALWGMLDVERAASIVRERFASAWPALAARFPWLADASEGEGDAVGAMAGQF